MWRVLPLLLMLCSAGVYADAMRCGTKLVYDGDSRAEVRARCGAPTEVQTRSIMQRPTVWRHGKRVYVGDAVVEVPVEIWLYNFGPHKLMQRLRFEGGKLRSIETLGYGFHPRS